ncbi:EAL domain-containing protein [Reinekea marina]|uniref:Bifunctional diguanylate cyclase/phosphodiesterase n=1 Tax=Reinekea marina TaxID=1310421 RepID=A0ABV7WTT7_9GAMM|nr:GGDEF domain-containing phosphodiesterase [Reinekea marina]MDN3651053.1 EAL domain-containing protein [Reinekea marina]
MKIQMYSEFETLRHRRLQYLLKNAPYYWLTSLGLSILCAIYELNFKETLHLGSIAVLVCVSIAGYLSTVFSQVQARKDPLWSPVLWFLAILLCNSMVWGLFARHEPFFNSLALVLAAVASMAFYSHGRLSAAAIIPATLIPIPFLYFSNLEFLWQLHLPAIILIYIASKQRHSMGLANVRSDFEASRLNHMMTTTQTDLQKTIQQKTHELQEANARLSTEVDLRKDVNQALINSEEQLSLAIATAGIGFWDWDIPARKVYHSDTERFFGFQQLPGQEPLDLFDIVLEDDILVIRKAMLDHLRGRTDYYTARYRVKTIRNQDIKWIEDTGKISERDDLGRGVRLLGTRRDITLDMQQQEELSLAASLFNTNPDGVFILDAQQNFRTCNRAFCDILQRQKGELLGEPLFKVLRTEQHARIELGVANNGRWNGDIVAARGKDERIPISLTLTAVTRDDKSVSHYLGIFRDLSDVSSATANTETLGHTDKLTGLYNRGYFHQVLNQFHEHRPLQENHYAVCVLNLDRFKTINESLGIEVGDQLLSDLAARLNNLQEPVRQVSRLSSDEFALIIEYENDQNHLHEILTAIQADVTRPFLVDDHELIVTASIGVCIVSENNLSQLMNHAIAAMNQARYKGGNNFQFYHQKLATSPLERLQLEKSLRKAIVNHEFSVEFQPKLNLSSGIIDSVEALVRWRHPHKGLLDPQDFIPLAEETGLISAIGEQVLNKACMEASTWRDRGFGDISVSVNLSSHQIRRDDLYEVIQNALKTSQLPAEYLELELTESMLMEDINHAQDFLNQLRSLGVRLALDDFGTGYSSLSYLKRLPIDTLKIDQSFVAEIRPGEKSPIVEAIMAMADSLNLSVVAEGVETRQQLEYLESLACDYAQGFIISRALPASEILTLIRHSNLQMLNQSPESVH